MSSLQDYFFLFPVVWKYNFNLKVDRFNNNFSFNFVVRSYYFNILNCNYNIFKTIKLNNTSYLRNEITVLFSEKKRRERTFWSKNKSKLRREKSKTKT